MQCELILRTCVLGYIQMRIHRGTSQSCTCRVQSGCKFTLRSPVHSIGGTIWWYHIAHGCYPASPFFANSSATKSTPPRPSSRRHRLDISRSSFFVSESSPTTGLCLVYTYGEMSASYYTRALPHVFICNFCLLL